MALAGRKRKQQGLARDDSVELRGGLQKTVADVGSANGTSNGNGEGSSNVNGTDSDSKDEWTTVTGGGGSALGASGRKKPKKEKVRPAAGASVDLAAPLFQFDPAGFRNKSSIQVNDVRDLILNLLAKNSHPKWLNIKNKNAIRGVVCVLIQGIEPPTLGLPSTSTLSDNLPQSLLPGLPKSSLPLFQKLFSHYCPTRAPGDRIKLHSVVQALLNAPIPAGEKQKRDQSRQKANSAFKSGGASGGEAAVAPDPAQYLLDPESFSENGYIVPSYGFDIAERRIRDPKGKSPAKLDRVTVRPFEEWQRDDGCIETPQLEHEDADADRPLLRILGIDCEMCVTTAGSEVCRISVVDGSGKCIYNTLVKPTNTVTDYATVYSGITEELLAPVTTRLEDVQRRLSELIDYDTALVGHSLNCDLVVLKLAHPWVIDTSVIYQHTRGPPFKASLKWLAQKWLNKEIQKPTKISTASSGKGETTEIIGHNSEEDARAAVELVNLKMQKGPHFGEFANDQESIFERLARDGNANFPESSSNGRKRSCIVDHGNPGQWHGAKANTAVACRTDDEVAKGVAENAEGHDFVFARLMDLSHTLGWSQPSNSVLGKTTAAQKNTSVVPAADVEAPKAEATDADIAQAYARLNEHLGAIHASLPLNTAFVVMSGHNDPRAVLALSQKKSKFDVLYRTGKPLSQMDKAELWTEEDDRNLASEVAKVREGMTFLSIRR